MLLYSVLWMCQRPLTQVPTRSKLETNQPSLSQPRPPVLSAMLCSHSHRSRRLSSLPTPGTPADSAKILMKRLCKPSLVRAASWVQ